MTPNPKKRRMLRAARYAERLTVLGGVWFATFFLAGICWKPWLIVAALPGFVLALVCMLFSKFIAWLILRPDRTEKHNFEKAVLEGKDLRRLAPVDLAHPAVRRLLHVPWGGLAAFFAVAGIASSIAAILKIEYLSLAVFGFVGSACCALLAIRRKKAQSVAADPSNSVGPMASPESLGAADARHSAPRLYRAWRNYVLSQQILRGAALAVLGFPTAAAMIGLLTGGMTIAEAARAWSKGVLLFAAVASPVLVFMLAVWAYSRTILGADRGKQGPAEEQTTRASGLDNER